jgi:hypothetical protein
MSNLKASMIGIEQLDKATPNIANLKRLRDLMQRQSSADEIALMAVVLGGRDRS